MADIKFNSIIKTKKFHGLTDTPYFWRYKSLQVYVRVISKGIIYIFPAFYDTIQNYGKLVFIGKMCEPSDDR